MLYPWIHQFCNNILSSDQTSPIQFPDVNPNQLNPDVNFSMAAGDFLEVYTDPGNVLVFIQIILKLIVS